MSLANALWVNRAAIVWNLHASSTDEDGEDVGGISVVLIETRKSEG